MQQQNIQICKQKVQQQLIVYDSFQQIVISLEKLERLLGQVPHQRQTQIPSSERCQEDLIDILKVIDFQLVLFQRQLDHVSDKAVTYKCYQDLQTWIKKRKNDQNILNNQNYQWLDFWVHRFTSIMTQPENVTQYLIQSQVTKFDKNYTNYMVQQYYHVDQKQRNNFENNPNLYNQNQEFIKEMEKNKNKNIESQSPYQTNQQAQQKLKYLLNFQNNDDGLIRQQQDTKMEEEKIKTDEAQQQQFSQNNQQNTH